MYIGPTRCGKTTLARADLAATDNSIILAPKRTWRWEDIDGTPLIGRRYENFATTFEELVRMLLDIERRRTGAPVVYQPHPDDWQQRNIWKIDRVYDLAYRRGGTIVYCDDQYFLTPYTSSERASNTLPGWWKCYTAGGEFAVGVRCSVQRSIGVPRITLNQTEYRFAFFQRDRDDQKSTEELCGPVDWPTLRAWDHSFVWATDKFTSAPMRLEKTMPESPVTI